MSNIWYIYKITADDGRAYVGVTKRGIMLRWRSHLNDALHGKDTYLYRAIRKYGVGYFSIQTLCECYSAREAKTAERALIAEHGTYVLTGNGFNLTYGGDGNWGWKPSAETRARIGAKSSERIAKNPDYVQKMVNGQRTRNRKRPECAAQARKLGYAKKGIRLSDEHKRKISEAGRGRICSPETIAKRKALRPKGVWKPSVESIAKMTATRREQESRKTHEKIEARMFDHYCLFAGAP